MKNNNEINILQPNNLDELDEILISSETKYDLVSGSTDLLVQEEKWLTYKNIIDLKSVKELSSEIIKTEDSVLIGSAVPFTEIINSELIKTNFPILAKACSMIGSIQIQNRGTLGGNVGNASPAGDSIPVLCALDSNVLIGPKVNGQFRTVKLSEYFTGFKTSVLTENEYIAYFSIPLESRNPSNWYFRKVGQRFSMAISKVSLALLIWLENNIVTKVSISTGSVNAVINRASKTEEFLIGKNLTDETIKAAVEIIKTEVNPIKDIRSNIEYRRHIAGELLKEALVLTNKP